MNLAKNYKHKWHFISLATTVLPIALAFTFGSMLSFPVAMLLAATAGLATLTSP